MNNLIPKEKIVKLAIAVASLSVVLYFGGLLVVIQETKKVENLYNDTESESSKGKKFWAIKSIAETNAGAIQALRNFFIKKNDDVKFIEQIESTARNSGIGFEIASIDVKPNQANLPKEDIEVKMAISGSWRETMRFVDSLEKMSFGVSVENINLDANGSGVWSGSVDFIIFREK
jgi:hypothetical protein